MKEWPTPIEVLEFKKKVTAERLGILTIRYYNIVMKCDLVLYRNERLWIRMAETWKNETKRRFVWWNEPESSTIFQTTCLALLHEKFDMHLDAAIEMKEAAKKNQVDTKPKTI